MIKPKTLEFWIDLESVNFPDEPVGQTKWDVWDTDMGECLRVIEYSAYEELLKLNKQLEEEMQHLRIELIRF